MLTYRSGGESHGPGITALLEGVPAGLPLRVAAIDAELRRRQGGFGRGGRMKIEQDRVQIRGGVIRGRTTGAPLVLYLENRDASLAHLPALRRPRPGHADMAGVQKYLLEDARPVLERASARETCARVAAGGVARQVLAALGMEIAGYVESIGGICMAPLPGRVDPRVLRRRRARSVVYCPDMAASRRMRDAIRAAARAGDTLGGTFVVEAHGVLPGLGSYAQWHQKLDGRLAQAVMSIPAIKGVEIGLGFTAATLPGSQVHDEIFWASAHSTHGGIHRGSDRAGGLEGGVTNGEPVQVRAAMKPIATLRKPLRSVDLSTRKASAAAFERSDVCAVPAASVVGEAMVLLTLADAVLEKFASDTMVELQASAQAYRNELRERF